MVQQENDYGIKKSALDQEKGKLDDAKAQIDAAKLMIEQLRQQGKLNDQAQQLEDQLKPKEAAYTAGYQKYQESKEAQLDGYKLLLDQGRSKLEAAKKEAQIKVSGG